MSRTDPLRLPLLVTELLSVPLGVYLAWQVHRYGSPWLLTVCVGWLAFSSYAAGCIFLADAWQTTTHRCPDPDCDFTVRLTGADAAESRRWQETAAAHPHHQVP